MTQADKLRGIGFGVAYRILGDPADAEDIAQESIARWLEADRTTIDSHEGFVAAVAARRALNLDP